MRGNIYNSLVEACILKTCNWIVMTLFHFVRVSLLSFFSSYITSSYLFACVTADRSIWGLGLEDTFQSLIGNPFKVWVNSSLLSQYMEKDLPSFRCCKVDNSLVKTRNYKYEQERKLMQRNLS